jgi:hypothetical protein
MVAAANAPGAASLHAGGRELRKFAVENATTSTCGPGAIPVSHRRCSVGLKFGSCGSCGMTEPRVLGNSLAAYLLVVRAVAVWIPLQPQEQLHANLRITIVMYKSL